MVELIVTAINVFILFFLIGYLVSDMLSGMLTKRQERIADDINTARMSKEEALAITPEQYAMLMQGLEIVARHPIEQTEDSKKLF